MGLFRTLIEFVADLAGVKLPKSGSRTYKVTLLGEPLGSFKLPVAEHRGQSTATTLDILTRPFQWDFGGMLYFYWEERNLAGGFKSVTWHPTPAEEAEARRFYKVSHASLPVLPAQPAEEARLVRAILADPEAERPYLDYAAWLTARGDSRGEYIRLTLDIEKLPGGSRGREKLTEKRQALVEKDGPRWVLPLTDVGLYTGVALVGVDGFWPDTWHGKKGVIEELEVPSFTGAFPRHFDRLFQAAPCLRKLSIGDHDVGIDDLGRVPQFAQLESLRANVGQVTPAQMRVFAQSPHLGGLRHLDMGGVSFGPDAAVSLAEAVWLPGLKSLNLYYGHILDAGATAIASSPGVANLEELNLSSNMITDAGLTAIASFPHLAKLKVLSLNAGTPPFGEEPYPPLTAAGIQALGGAVFAPTLKGLALDRTGLTADGVWAVTTAFPALTELSLGFIAAGAEGMRAIGAAAFIRTLQSLMASEFPAGDAGVEALVAGRPAALHTLCLPDNRISDRGVLALSLMPAVATLKILMLSSNSFGQEGAAALAEAKFPALVELDLCGVPLGPQGAKALCAAGAFPKLTKLSVTEELVGPGGKAALTKRFGNALTCY